MDKKYDLNQIRQMIAESVDKSLLEVNGSFDNILSNLDTTPEESVLKYEESFNTHIQHEMFEEFMIEGIMDDLFTDVSTIDELREKIILLSAKHYEEIGRILENDYTHNKMLGDLFEIFAEIFFKLTSVDNRIGVSNYTPVESKDDYGVDGYGLGFNDKPCTIQVKFKSDPTEFLTIKDLKNYQGLSYTKYDVDVKDTRNLIIFTNCTGIHWSTETNILKNKTVTYGVFGGDGNHDKSLSNLLDNNKPFWKKAIEYVQYSKKVLENA